MKRSGDCNQCGQCCGADGSPEQKNPWPRGWPGTLRTWKKENLPTLFELVKHPSLDATLRPDESFNLDSKSYYGIWIPGSGLCKDLPPYGDIKTYSVECPFLIDDPGNETRPCALVGTRDSIWEEMCQPVPPIEKTEEQVTKWRIRHPLCSYIWE